MLGIYTLTVKIYYSINSKDQKNKIASSLALRRSEVAKLIRKEYDPMRQVLEELINQYPKLRVIIEKRAAIRNETIDQFLTQRTTVQLTAINADFFKKLMNKNFNKFDEKISATYNKYSTFVVTKIHELAIHYLDAINNLYNYRVDKLPWYKLKKPEKTDDDLRAYLERIVLVDKWSFLSQIYESISNI